jgi:N6-adenosine-specific RNA methylase IME4
MNYQTLPLYEIRKLESFLPKVLIAHDCALFLWRVSSMVEEAYSVCRDWGFAPKTELVWIKKTKYGLSHFGMGRYLRAAHETCIVAIRGSWKPQHLSQRTIFEAQTGRHSEKPDEFYKLVVDLTAGPRAELFARRQRDGFFSFGNEVENVVC